MMGISRRAAVLVAAGLGAVLSCAAGADPLEDKVKMCSACHGQAGLPVTKEIPIIWGQQEGYIYLQLRDFKSGARSNPIMSPLASQLQRDDMIAVAEYFSGKRWPDAGQAAASDADANAARTTSASIGCPACHSAQFQGDGTTPRVAGQNAAYLAKTLGDFRTGARANNPGMSDFARAIPDADLAAMVNYLAGL